MVLHMLSERWELVMLECGLCPQLDTSKAGLCGLAASTLVVHMSPRPVWSKRSPSFPVSPVGLASISVV